MNGNTNFSLSRTSAAAVADRLSKNAYIMTSFHRSVYSTGDSSGCRRRRKLLFLNSKDILLKALWQLLSKNVDAVLCITSEVDYHHLARREKRDFVQNSRSRIS